MFVYNQADEDETMDEEMEDEGMDEGEGTEGETE